MLSAMIPFVRYGHLFVVGDTSVSHGEGLVSCTKSKRERAARPAELYVESVFLRKERRYAGANHGAWCILPAKHHPLHPDGPRVEPHDHVLRGASVSRRGDRSRIASDQLREEGLRTDGTRPVFHAGRDDDEPIPSLEETPTEIEASTDGLQCREPLA